MSISRWDRRRNLSSASVKKGQAAIEFIIVFTILIAVLIAVTYNSHLTANDINSVAAEGALTDALDSMKFEIDTVYLGGDGFSSNITIPDEINGKNYTVNITNGFIIVNISGDIKNTQLMTNNISGTLKKGVNVVKNVGDSLVIS